jgi:ferredoxin-NADP reductase
MPPNPTLDVQIRDVRSPATDILTLSLGRPSGAALPRWQPGAHVDIHLPSGAVRQYSLHSAPGDRRTYEISVLRVADGRGGSAELHDLAHPGAALRIGLPRNNFELHPAGHYLFVAGGIGITALLPMIRAVSVAPATASWQLVYVGRRRARMAFTDEVAALGATAGRTADVVAVDERGRPDLAEVVRSAPVGSTVYCCGPPRMLDAVDTAVRDLRPEFSLHSERFTPASPHRPPDDTPFEVVMARSGTSVTVAPGVSILDAVRAVKPDVMSSCERGICSACETAVLDGIPDHRDSVLTPAEHAANRYIMLCVSRARTARLVLDL